MDFCYIARRDAIDEYALEELEQALARFHHYRQIFVETGVRADTISLPRQHSLCHYSYCIRLFGSPNGLCSSITESKHIKAVKEPWRRSSRYKALIQMLRTNRRLDKMAAARSIFTARGMMVGSTSSYTSMILDGGHPTPLDKSVDDDEDYGPVAGPKIASSVKLARTRRKLFFFVPVGPQTNTTFRITEPVSEYPRDIQELANHINQPQLPALVRRFLYDQLNPDKDSSTVPIEACPLFSSRVYVHHSAIAQFYAPSNLCGTSGMYRETIRSTPCWRGEYERRDTVFIGLNDDLPGMAGMAVGRVFLFFSFTHENCEYPCALIQWFMPDNSPDEDTRMWIVRPERIGRHPSLSVIHLDCIPRAAHLIGVYGSSILPEDFHFSYTLDAFKAFYVNPYADHHMHEFLV